MSLPPRRRGSMTTVQSSPSLTLRRHDNDRHASMSLPPCSELSSPPPYQVAVNRHRSNSSYEFTSATNTAEPVFTPSSPPVVVSRLKKSSSSSHLLSRSEEWPAEPESLSDNEDILYAVHPNSGPSTSHMGPKSRFSGPSGSKAKPSRRTITTRGRGAGETETELDEPPRPLPTSRRLPPRPPLSPPTPLARMTPVLFQAFRLLSCVPAFAGACSHILGLYKPPSGHSRLDYFVCLLWALLTAHQCLRLTTGLLTRWKTYYPPLPTLIRLLALQVICWPATKFTLVLLDHERRPVVCWAVIGSTTCISRSVQIWVTSNLWGPSNVRLEGKGTDTPGVKWGARRWDWTEVGVKCALPMGVVYFVMAWAEALRRELWGC